ncbi:MAG TPA: Trx7/PDZ domain-containing (seleno)protein, partial [Isosphaeraceae bacterium]
RNDRNAFQSSSSWIYNDLDQGVRASKESGKPLLVVFRCIPCKACQEFDDDVARRDPVIRDLLDEFVCVRVVQANTIDLTHFQHDFDQSFAAYLMNPDLTIYGRFGTRSGRPEHEDISLEGLRKAMAEALRMHREYGKVKASLAGKQVQQARYKSPRDYPSLSGKYGESIDYEGKAARSCMHCHQIREAERLVYRSAKRPIPDEVLFPYPDPAVLGLKLDPREAAKVERVMAASIAERAGLRAGDVIETLVGQPLLSIADLQWVLHNAPPSTKLPARVSREGKAMDLTLDLTEGWRRGDISWRATTWDLRRMGLGGLRLEELTAAQRAESMLALDSLALRVKHLGEYGDHAVAKRAGFQKGDILVSFDGRTGRMTETDLLAYALQEKRPGDEVTVTVLRRGRRETLRLALQ